MERARLIAAVDVPSEELAEEALGSITVRHFERQVTHIAEPAAGHVLDRDVVGFDGRGDEPSMAEGITDHTTACAVVDLDRAKELCAFGDRHCDRRVRVRHVDHERDAAAAERVRSEMELGRILVRQHEDRVADAQLGVPDVPVGHDDRIAEKARFEHVLVPLDGTVRALHAR